MLDFTTLRESILNNVYVNGTNTYRIFDNTGAATGANTSGDIVESSNVRETNLSTRNTQDDKIETDGGLVGGIDYVPFQQTKYNKITDKYDYDNINERLTNNGFRELETYKKQLREEDYFVQYGGSNINNIYYLKRDEVDNDLVAGSNLSIEALKQIQDIKDFLGGDVGSNIEGSTAKIKYIRKFDAAITGELTETQKLTREAAKYGQDIKDFLGGSFGGSNYINEDNSLFSNVLTGTKKLTRRAAKHGQDIKDFLGGDFGGSNYINEDNSLFSNVLTGTKKLTRRAAKRGQDIKDFDGGVFGGSNYIKETDTDFSNVLTGTKKLTRQAAKRGQDIKDFDGGDFGGSNYIKETDTDFSNVLTGTKKLTRQAAKRGQDIKDFDGGDFGGSNYIKETDTDFSNELTGIKKLTRQATQQGQDIKDYIGGDFGGIKYVNNRTVHTNKTDINNFEQSYDYSNRLSYLKYTENTLTETLTRNELISLRNAKETTMTTKRTTYWTNNENEATISEWNVDNDEHGSNFLEGSFPEAFNIV
jgi:hypothetical protein